MDSDPKTRLVEEICQWSAGFGSPEFLIDAASCALGEGVDLAWVERLALLAPSATDVDVSDVLAATPPDLGFEVFPRGTDEAFELALVPIARRCLDGGMTPRELARWAHRTIGHGRSDLLERLVVLDDVYDDVDYFGRYDVSYDDEVRAVAREISSRPLPVDRLTGD